MQIISARRAPPGTRALAFIDIDAGGLRVFNVEICRAADGRLRAWPPKLKGAQVATFTVDLADELGRAALAALKDGSAHAG